MKYRGNQYELDIKKLKSLKIRDKAAYKAFMITVCNEHSVSEKTVYRDMCKRVPGLRKTRKDQGKDKTPVKAKELAIAGELLSAGHNIKKTKEVLMAKTGKKVSGRKITKIIDKVKAAPVTDNVKSVFGKNIREFLEQFFEYDLIAPDKGIKLKYNNFSFTVNKEDINDIIMIISNAYNREQFSNNNKLSLDRDELREHMILQLMEKQISLAKESGDLKACEALTRMHDRMKVDVETSADFKVLQKIVRELKPAITTSELVSLIKKHTTVEE
jgi:hypothetical protein